MAAFFAIAGRSFGDRVILTPSGETLATGRFRVEGIMQTSETQNRRLWAAVGLSRFEIEAQRIETRAGDDTDLLNIEVGLLPQTVFTPAVGLGVIDASDQIERTFYAAISKTVPLPQSLALPVANVRLTAGFASGLIEGLYAGAEGTVLGFRIQVEHDSEDLNAAIGIPILGVATAKALWIKKDFYVGLEIKPRF